MKLLRIFYKSKFVCFLLKSFSSSFLFFKIEEVKSVENVKEKNIRLESKMNELRSNPSLDLSSLKINDDDLNLILRFIIETNSNQYQQLVLRDNQLTAIGIEKLVQQFLQTRTSIRNIGLSSNPLIGDRAIEHLIKLLQSDQQSITILCLHNTGITNRSVRLLADFLCPIDENQSTVILEKLYISFNRSITDQCFDDLLRIIQLNRSLTLFAFQHCRLSDRIRRKLRITAAKKRNKSFQLFD